MAAAAGRLPRMKGQQPFETVVRLLALDGTA
jgi:hypothetical protein